MAGIRTHEIIYNASEDKDLWTDPRIKRLYDPKTVLGRVPTETSELVEAMGRKGFWPVMEGKHIEQFLVGIAPVRWWLSAEQAKRKYGKEPCDSKSLVFRDMASNTNERTCIAAALPTRMAGAHSLSGIFLDGVDVDAAASVLNSCCFDYCLRFRTAGTHVSFTCIRPMPVPPPEMVNHLPKIATKLAWVGGLEHISDARENWPRLWESNRAGTMAAHRAARSGEDNPGGRMNKMSETAYQTLHAIYDRHRRRYRGNPDSKQMCCMWSADSPPDVIEETRPLRDIEKAFGIDLDEDAALILYDMNLEEAARKIVEMQNELNRGI